METRQLLPKHAIIGLLIILSLSSVSLFLIAHEQMLLAFIMFYAAISFTYLIFRYSFAIINYPTHHFQQSKKGRLPSVSIVIPVYNEEKKLLEQCIKSMCEASYPDKEVIFIDDGSSDKEVLRTLERMQVKYRYRAFQLLKNVGKRKAMAFGFRKANGEILIAGDSDTVIPSGRSIRRLVEPFKNRKVGSVSGCVMVKNVKDTLMTRIQDARYWLAFFVEKSSQNPYDSVTCASGPFSAYRREYIMEFLDEWEHQVFLGQECTYGDDRGLTTFMLKQGYDVKFARDAFAYTNVPATLGKLVKQQTRWKKSFIRENYYLMGFIKNRNPFMVAEFVLFWTVFLAGFVAKLITFIFLLTGRIEFFNLMVMVVFVALLHYIYVFLRSPGLRGYYGIMYGILNEFLISWLIFPAFFGLRDTKWGTR